MLIPSHLFIKNHLKKRRTKQIKCGDHLDLVAVLHGPRSISVLSVSRLNSLKLYKIIRESIFHYHVEK